MHSEEEGGVWVFNGAGATFPSGVFRQKALAEAWIRSHSLGEVLTWYPLDAGTLEWAVENGHFKAKREEQSTAAFKGAFTSIAQPHFHYQHGNEQGS